MARCPKLVYLSDAGGPFSECEYRCSECGRHFYESDSQLKYTCDATSGYYYEQCEIYKNSR